MKKITLILQARCNSSRLPKKILLKFCGKTVLEHMIDRINILKNKIDIIIATTTLSFDDELYEFCKKKNIKCYRGSENDVLDRYYQTALINSTDVIIRCTSDCPLLDVKILDNMLDKYLNNDYKYYMMKYYGDSFYPSGFPDGFDIEIFDFESLKDVYLNAVDIKDRQDINRYFIRNYKGNTYKIPLIKDYNNLNLKNLHLSLDTKNDYKIIKNIYENLYPSNEHFGIYDILEYLNNNPNILNYNFVEENVGQMLYEKAKNIIPGGTQLLSKRPEMFLPKLWPAYYRKANGIEVVTLDGIKLLDFSYMGIGSCILGYCDVDVNSEVHNSIDRGNMTTLNCPSEIKLTKLLCKLHPWADMARYTRSGGEACAVAIRISRTASNKDKIAFCGYHGWHDWYLSANLNNDDELKEHLLPGLKPNGVPKNLKNTAFPFRYNHIEDLEKIIDTEDVGTIIMEPIRNIKPENNFLQKVKEIATKHNIILIFDEITSGFRLNTGGIHLLYNIEPDIAIFGKAISNGYPISAIIGKKNVMQHAENTFISSTYWTEDIGFIASIATINKHKKLDVGNYINTLGIYFQNNLKNIAIKTDINITVSGIPALTTFNFNYDNNLEIKTLYIQKMLEKNILAKNVLYLSYAHTKQDIDYYLLCIEEIFNYLCPLIKNNDIKKNLIGEVVHSDFKRLT